MSQYSIRLPISAFIFYLFVILLIYIGILPSLQEIYLILKSWYENYGHIGLFFATLLEGLVYIGLYFPGSLIIVFACFLSDGSFLSFLHISLIVAFALTIDSIINYTLGRNKSLNKFLKPKKIKNKKNELKNNFFYTIFLHPNILAFYFYTMGAKGELPKQILLVPIIMIPLGLLLAYFFYSIRDSARNAIENPFTMIIIFILWFLIAISINFYKTIKNK
ncbi:MAG: hypothetical protein KC589_00945 [Nanoarchaeota archaeon]|nr:hypothetical protein [Nanoarchaeota archaeon]